MAAQVRRPAPTARGRERQGTFHEMGGDRGEDHAAHRRGISGRRDDIHLPGVLDVLEHDPVHGRSRDSGVRASARGRSRESQDGRIGSEKIRACGWTGEAVRIFSDRQKLLCGERLRLESHLAGGRGSRRSRAPDTQRTADRHRLRGAVLDEKTLAVPGGAVQLRFSGFNFSTTRALRRMYKSPEKMIAEAAANSRSPMPASVPTAATAQMTAAVVKPCTRSSVLMMMPAPRKPMPTTMLAMTVRKPLFRASTSVTSPVSAVMM